MNKREALEILLDKKTIQCLFRLGISLDIFLDVLSKDSYNLKELGGSMQSRANLFKELFPGKPNNTKVCSWIFNLNEHKYCQKCKNVLHHEDFHINSSKHDGLGSQCISCHYKQLIISQPAVSAKRRAAKLQRTPKWSNLEEIARIYKLCPAGHHVDHIIPLQGKYVSGLHVANNLQYLLANENLVKSNKYMPT